MNKETIFKQIDLTKTYKIPKIAYIILTCEKYEKTRVNYQKETFLKNVNYYYISRKMDEPNHIYGFDTDDSYDGCPNKYLHFIRNMNLDYDWYIFIDDDSYVFPDKLIQFLTHFDSEQCYYMGVDFSQTHILTHYSGGAGFLLSKPAYTLLKTYLQNEKNIQDYKKEYAILYPGCSLAHGDVFMAMWISETNKEHLKIQYVNIGEYFHAYPNKDPEFIKKIITLHYLKEDDYQFYFLNT
jgi:hypothetical protein